MVIMRRRPSLVKIIALIVVFMLSFFTGKSIADWGAGDRSGAGPSLGSGADDVLPDDRLNILLLGVDARPGEKDARTDTMILVSIDRDTKKIAMVSIPRDTLVDIPGHGQGKINTANLLGGPYVACQTVEGLLDIKVPYYVKTNFDGFKDIIDTLGGVDIDVEKRMVYRAENINLYPGPQHLDGYNALGYVRFRHDALGDIGRTERQQKFLRALAKETLRAGTILKLPVLVPQFMEVVDTNLGPSDALLVARVATKMGAENMVTATLPGVFYNYKGASYWKIDEDKAKLVLNDLFGGTEVATITGPDINVPANRPVVKTPAKTDETASGQDSSQNPEGDRNPEGQVPADQTGSTGPDDSGQTVPGGSGSVIITPIPPDGTSPDSPEPGQPNQNPAAPQQGDNNPQSVQGKTPGTTAPGQQVPPAQQEVSPPVLNADESVPLYL